MKREEIKKHALDVLQIILIGVLVALGMRAVEWVVPAPDMRIVFCLEGDGGVCKTLAELKEHM